MSVRVVTTIQTNLPGVVTHSEGVRWRESNGYLDVHGQDDKVFATYAPGTWASAEVLHEPEQVNAAAHSPRLAGMPPAKVTVVVEDHDGTVTTYTADHPEDVDVQVSRDALPDGDENGWRKVKPSPLAHFDVRVVVGDVERRVVTPAGSIADCPEAAKCASVTLTEPVESNSITFNTSAEAVLSETSEPYVCVSVTGNDPETVAATLAKLG